MLESIENNESISLFKNNKKIWQITKKYDFKNFDDDETSLGYAVDIYQETINKTFREYLVNFDYLVRVLENYGFVTLNDSEIRNINMPSSISSFEVMYDHMLNNLEKDKQLKNLIGNSLNMSDEEKQISFLNNCFVFKKVRNVSNIPSLIKNNEEDDKLKMEAMDIDKKLLDEQVDEISKDEMDFKMEQESIKLEKEKQKGELTIDEKIKLAEEKKKAKLLEKELEKQKIKEEKAKKKSEKKEIKKSEKKSEKK